jgi:Ca-activated chloride channel family protein
MAFRLLLLCALCSRSLGPSAAVAQAPAASTPAITPLSDDTASPRLRVLDLIAFDKDGRLVTDLKPEELRLVQNNTEQKIRSLSPAAREPLTIGLFFDVSGSRRADKYVDEETRLAGELVHSIWQEGDTAFLVGFGERVVVVTQPTHKPGEIDEGLKQVPGGYSGSTALYDALCLLKPEKLAAVPGRKVYVVFSDFGDNSSRNSIERALDVAREAGVAIFPVILYEGFGSQSKKEEKLDRERAQRVADGTGGEVLIPVSHQELAQVFQSLAADLQSGYRLTYTPSSSASLDKRKRSKLKLQTTRAGVKLLYPKD